MTAQPLTARPARPRPGARRGWPLVTALALLSAIPLIAGALRLIQLAGGPELIPAEERFGAFPAALITHIAASAVFALLGALQFVPRFRSRRSGWHRKAGRVVGVVGLLVAASGLWMTLLYAPRPGTGDLLYVSRLTFASAMAASLVLGYAAIRRRDFAAHGAWMVRAYAIGLGAGTQIITEGFGQAIFGTGVLAGDLAKLAGWVVNLAVAEWAIRRSRAGRRAGAPS